MTDERPRWERFDPSRVVGSHLLAYGEVTSTMDVAWRLADGEAGHGTVVRAASQTRGRGRFSRRWVSGPSDSLLVSIVLRSTQVALGALLPIAATLAVRDTVSAVARVSCAVKWPNDVHVAGRKIAGILVESRIDTAGDGVAVIGIGLNVNLDPATHPEIAETATSLAVLTGKRCGLDATADTLFAALDSVLAELGNGAALVERWRSSLDTLGRLVTVHQRDGVLEGTAEDVDDAGRLLLRTDDGRLHTLSEGDVTLRA